MFKSLTLLSIEVSSNNSSEFFLTIVRFNLNGVPSSFITFKFKSAKAFASFNASLIALLAEVGNESSLLKLMTKVSL